MKLYNHSKIPDDILRSVLTAAGRAVGVRTQDTLVKITEMRRSLWWVGGHAYDYNWVRRWAVDGKPRYTKSSNKTRLRVGYIECSGMIKLVLPPTLDNPHDPLERAESIYRVAAHEWQHIKDFQAHNFDFRNPQDRRKRHDNRPWEKAAIKAAHKATQRPHNTAQDAILRLAEYLEEAGKPSKSRR